MLNPTLLQAFCEGFYGYGSADASHWFISMEEGGGASENEIQTRLDVWHSRGCRELEEIDEFHRSIRQDKWFGSRPPVQKTWAAAIRMVLSLEGKATDLETVRAYQRDSLARTGGQTRLSPLFPLPSISIDNWDYESWSGAVHFSNRSNYKKYFESMRIECLRKALLERVPRTVVFFGTSYLDYWSRIVQSEINSSPEGLQFGLVGNTKFVICRHPATQGITNEYFIAAANFLKDFSRQSLG
jgi:hypothetical protein